MQALYLSIPYATLPVNLDIRGPRYRVMFDRIATPRFTKFGTVDPENAVLFWAKTYDIGRKRGF